MGACVNINLNWVNPGAFDATCMLVYVHHCGVWNEASDWQFISMISRDSQEAKLYTV